MFEGWHGALCRPTGGTANDAPRIILVMHQVVVTPPTGTTRVIIIFLELAFLKFCCFPSCPTVLFGLINVRSDHPATVSLLYTYRDNLPQEEASVTPPNIITNLRTPRPPKTIIISGYMTQPSWCHPSHSLTPAGNYKEPQYNGARPPGLRQEPASPWQQRP